MAPSKEKTELQQLPDLVSWYISNYEIELNFARNETNHGKLAPEFDFIFMQQSRRITEAMLTAMMSTEFGLQGRQFPTTKIQSALRTFAWRFYLENQEYPEWLAAAAPILRKPKGRPRKKPKLLTFNPTVVEIEKQLTPGLVKWNTTKEK